MAHKTLMLDWRRLAVELTRRMWFRATLMGLLATALALVGLPLQGLVPQEWLKVDASQLSHILTTLASSMLLVTTFSLSTVVTAYAAATSNATPRASKLLVEDGGVQRTLAGFIGAFVFSIVALLALSTGAYGQGGRLILLITSALVLLMIVAIFLRWIDNVSRLGQVSETIARAERATREAMKALAQAPQMHCQAWSEPAPHAVDLRSRGVGHLTFVDVAKLQKLAAGAQLEIWVETLAGAFMTPGVLLARLSRAVDADLATRLLAAFVIEADRSFDQDPRYGLLVLTEMAQRALSPAVNDPGTADDVIGAVTRLLCGWADARQHPCTEQVQHERIRIRTVEEAGYFEDVYASLARDCAGMMEVMGRLQVSLARLGQLGYEAYRAPAAHQAARALVYSDEKILIEEDRRQLQHIAAWRHDA